MLGFFQRVLSVGFRNGLFAIGDDCHFVFAIARFDDADCFDAFYFTDRRGDRSFAFRAVDAGECGGVSDVIRKCG